MTTFLCSLFLLAASEPTSAPALTPDEQRDAAEVAHAEGLIEEVDGHYTKARELLLKASDLAPDNIAFAFDLARNGWEHRLDTKKEDAARFLSMPPVLPEHSLLRAYLLADGKNKDEAKAAVDKTLALDPQNPEAQRLAELIDKPGSAVPKTVKPWGVRARVGIEYDSNVTLIQDATPSDEGGPRLMLSGGASWAPQYDNVRLSIGVDLNAGIHLANRTRLSLFDFAQILPRFGVDARLGDNRLMGSVYTSQVFLNGFAQHFMQDYAAVAEYRRIFAEVWQPGAYAGVGYRDYTSTSVFNTGEGTSTDRDGLHFNGGLGLNFSRNDVVAHLRAGAQLEQADGADQRQVGPEADFFLRFNVYRFSFGATLSYMGRFYRNSSLQRVDQRVSSGFVGSVTLTKWLFLDIDYRVVRNVSNVLAFDYIRHLTALTVRANY